MRLIEAEALDKALAEEAVFKIKQADRDSDRAEARGLILGRKYIADAPTVDAVEVVRCSECRFNSTCERIVKIVPKNSKGGSLSAHLHGCEYGERKDGVHSAGQNTPENAGKAHRDADGEEG